MHFIYNCSIRLLGFVYRIASLFNTKAKLWINGRKNVFENLPDVSNKKVYWFHCASLGEFDQGLPLMKQYRENVKDAFILVTFFSPSGMLHYNKRDHNADFVMYLPLDTPSNASQFIQHFKPINSHFIKYEFWANYIFEAKKHHSKIFNISGIFRNKHRFFKWYGGFFRKVLKQFDHFFVQNSKSKELLNTININCVTVAGDSRFDRVIDNKIKITPETKLEQFAPNRNAFIIGSSWPNDESILLPIINELKEKVIIAPHNVDEKHVNAIIEKITRKHVLFSKSTLEEIANSEVLILDTIGHLSNAYSYGKIAYVGGGFSGNLHNILEPAAFGLPVIFGPKHERFPEAENFINGGFGFSIRTINELKKAFKFIMHNYTEISSKEVTFVKENTGATDRIFNFIHSN
jgi:3-deoxy-D-manno-octulosonic-acid transferase